MTDRERIIDAYVCETAIAFASLGDHLMTLDALREHQKFSTLRHFGFPDSPTKTTGLASQIVDSHLTRFDVHMGTYLRYSHLILTYIVLEDRLAAFGKLLASVRSGQPEFSSRGGGSLLDRFGKYLDSASITRPSDDQWDKVDLLRLARNCIVHSNGFLNEFGQSTELRKVLPLEPGIAVNTETRLVLCTEACLRLQENAQHFLRSVDRTVKFNVWIPKEVRKKMFSQDSSASRKPEAPPFE